MTTEHERRAARAWPSTPSSRCRWTRRSSRSAPRCRHRRGRRCGPSGRFVLNVLDDYSEEISRRFAARDVDRFAGTAHHPAPSGPPDPGRRHRLAGLHAGGRAPRRRPHDRRRPRRGPRSARGRQPRVHGRRLRALLGRRARRARSAAAAMPHRLRLLHHGRPAPGAPAGPGRATRIAAAACTPSTISANTASRAPPSAQQHRLGDRRDARARRGTPCGAARACTARRASTRPGASSPGRGSGARPRRLTNSSPNATRSRVSGRDREDDQRGHRDDRQQAERADEDRSRVLPRGGPAASPPGAGAGRSRSRPRRRASPPRPPRRRRRRRDAVISRLAMITSTFCSAASSRSPTIGAQPATTSVRSSWRARGAARPAPWSAAARRCTTLREARADVAAIASGVPRYAPATPSSEHDEQRIRRRGVRPPRTTTDTADGRVGADALQDAALEGEQEPQHAGGRDARGGPRLLAHAHEGGDGLAQER